MLGNFNQRLQKNLIWLGFFTGPNNLSGIAVTYC